MLASKLLAASGGVDKLWVDECFSAYTYTGNGSTQTINNGIDLAGKGGMVWTKERGAVQVHCLVDTSRGTNTALQTDGVNAGTDITGDFGSFGASGYTLNAPAVYNRLNQNSHTYVSWAFRKAPKFFDVVTYSGNNVAGRQIPHSLGVAPGMVIVKCSSSSYNWWVWHRGLTSGNYIQLNSTNAQASASAATLFGNGSVTVDPNSSVFTVGGAIDINGAGQTYVAYLFAHDTSTDGIIQCGSFTTDASGNAPNVNLGWEPQFIQYKRTDATGNWGMLDQMRGFVSSDYSPVLFSNLSNAESPTGGFVNPTATGFQVTNSRGTASSTYIYLAIRRPNKPPTVGTQVYNAIARTGTGAAATVTGVGFAPDLVFTKSRQTSNSTHGWWDRLRGKNNLLQSATSDPEYSAGMDNVTGFDVMDGIKVGADASTILINQSGAPYINHFFKRAVGVFDSSCDTGTGSIKSESHNLKAVPELIIRKGRSGATQWEVYFAALGNTQKLVLNSTAAAVTDTTAWNSTTPTASNFTVGMGANVNTNTATYVTYLAASLAGISKVGTYVGNGTSQTINMGFTTGCRYFLVKASSTTGSWWVYDSVRGIVASADFALQLNSTAAEITSADCVDPASSGIVVNQEATCSINANSVTYQYWAFA